MPVTPKASGNGAELLHLREDVAKEHRPHLLECLRPRRFNRQWRADQHAGLDDLVDRLRDQLRIASATRLRPRSDRASAGTLPPPSPVSSTS